LIAPLPGLTSINTTEGLPPYLNTIFRLLIGLSGVIGVVMIVIYGITYMVEESVTGKSAALKHVGNTVAGLILLISVVVILNTINPNLTNISLRFATVTGDGSDSIEQFVADPQTGPHNTTGACPYHMTTTHTQGGVNYTSDDSNVQQNLTALQTAINDLNAKVIAAGGTMTVNSAHRSLAYQAHLYEIKTLNAGLKADNNPNCDDLRATILTEITGHSLSGCDSLKGCVVAKPDGCAPHVKGTGADLSFSGITRAAANELASSNNIPLKWQQLTDDPAHWNLQEPPFAGCAAQ
jgi:hypothetical protein